MADPVKIEGLRTIDPHAVPLPHGTEITTTVDRSALPAEPDQAAVRELEVWMIELRKQDLLRPPPGSRAVVGPARRHGVGE